MRTHLDRIVAPGGGRLRLFLTADWEDLSETLSFRHDIEASWLLFDAATALGDEALIERAAAVSIALARAMLEMLTRPRRLDRDQP